MLSRSSANDEAKLAGVVTQLCLASLVRFHGRLDHFVDHLFGHDLENLSLHALRDVRTVHALVELPRQRNGKLAT